MGCIEIERIPMSDTENRLFEIDFRLDCLRKLKESTKSEGFTVLIKDLEKKRDALLATSKE